MCYLEPAAAAIVTTFVWKSRKTPQVFWLMLMFYGGSLFGIIDHLWNGELFFVSKNWAKDVMLGAVVTAAITLAWLGILFFFAEDPVLFFASRSCEAAKKRLATGMKAKEELLRSSNAKAF